MELIKGSIDLDGVPVLRLEHIRRSPRVLNSREYCDHLLKICMVKQGKGEWIVGEKKYEISAGDVLIFNNTEGRTLRKIYPPDDLIVMVLSFEPRLIWNNRESIFNSAILRIFFNRNHEFENRLQRSHLATEEICGLMACIENEFINRLLEYKQMTKVKLLEILLNLNRHFAYAKDEKEEAFCGRHRFTSISRVIDYLNAHITEDYTLDKLAQIAHLNPCYLSNVFKKINGISITEYIMRKRVYLAIEYLEGTDYSILQIANLSGFNTPSNFYKAFKKVTGTVPLDFRKQRERE